MYAQSSAVSGVPVTLLPIEIAGVFIARQVIADDLKIPFTLTLL